MRETPKTNHKLVSVSKKVYFCKMYMFCYPHFIDHVGSLEVVCNGILIYNKKDHFS